MVAVAFVADFQEGKWQGMVSGWDGSEMYARLFAA
jgi:hypothetical protein